MPNAAIVSCAWQPDGGPMYQLRRITEPNASKDQHGEAEALFGLAPEAYGYSDDIKPSYRLTFSTLWTVGGSADQEYDWEAAADRKEEGTFYLTKGTKTSIYPAKVVSCEEAADAMRKVSHNVTLLARTKRQ